MLTSLAFMVRSRCTNWPVPSTALWLKYSGTSFLSPPAASTMFPPPSLSPPPSTLLRTRTPLRQEGRTSDTQEVAPGENLLLSIKKINFLCVKKSFYFFMDEIPCMHVWRILLFHHLVTSEIYFITQYYNLLLTAGVLYIEYCQHALCIINDAQCIINDTHNDTLCIIVWHSYNKMTKKIFQTIFLPFKNLPKLQNCQSCTVRHCAS